MYKKAITIIIIILTVIGIAIVSFVYFSEWIYPEFNGSYNLGGGFYMLECEKGRRIIVRGCSFEGKTCYGGIQVAPSLQEQYDNLGNMTEYTIDAKYSERWIIVKSYNISRQKNHFYIIDKDYNKSASKGGKEIMRFTDSTEFVKNCKYRKIDLKW